MGEFELAEEIKDSITMLRNKLDQIQPELPEIIDDYHKLFLYFIGDHFEGILPEKIKICDRKGDQKIDFYHVGENRFAAYQCKLPDLDLIESEGKIQTFGSDLVNEAEDILTFLTDSTGTAKGNKDSQEARNRYRSMRESAENENSNYKLEVILAYFGKLTKPAMDKLEELRKLWSKDSYEFEITTIDFEQISSELRLSLFAPSRPKKIKLEYRPKTEVHTTEWGYTLVPAIRFNKLFENYKMSLFDLNVRYYLGRSSVNREIISTLNTTQGQNNFHLLNNGITISCRSWEYPKGHGENWIILHHPQIINGCQTVISIYRAYNQMKEEHKRRNFLESCFVPVRIVNTQNPVLLDEVVTASNNQNKMSPRNLRSNRRTQRTLQNKFDQLSLRWFYERKDGEFESTKEYGPRGFKVKNYQFDKNQFRKLSNEDLAKSWLSFIGFSKDASEKINAFDFDEDGGRYEWLFEKRPNANHWNAITLGPQVSLEEDNFEPFPPSPEQYLLSHLIFEFIKAYLPTTNANKKDCKYRLKESGKINEKSSAEDINKAMMEDDTYVLNQILYNMKEVIAELYSWIIIKTYGPLKENVAKQILALSEFRELCENPDFKSFVKELEEKKPSEKLNNLLFCCFEFIKEAVRRWQSVYEHEYFTSQRRIRFLHTAKTVEQMKNYLQETDKNTINFGYEWKPPKKKFLESLPKLL